MLIRIVALLSLAASGWLVLPAVAAEPAQTGYFDGRQWRSIWQSERELAEIVDPNNAAPLAEVATGARLVQQSDRLRIWRLQERPSKAAALRRSLGAAERKRFTPVFHLSPEGGGARLVLAGNIVVQFEQTLDQAQVERWAQQQGLTLVNRMSLPDTWLFAAADGLAALEKANAIQQSGEVRYAIPEWLRPLHKR